MPFELFVVSVRGNTCKLGIRTPKDSVYLNHLLSYVKSGAMKGLTNRQLRELGAEIELCPGLPDFFPALKEFVRELGRKHNVEVTLEHYVISTGLAEMIRGTSLAAHCDGIYGCEFLEHPLPPHFSKQDELALELPTEITQVAAMVATATGMIISGFIAKGLSSLGPTCNSLARTAMSPAPAVSASPAAGRAGAQRPRCRRSSRAARWARPSSAPTRTMRPSA